MFDSRARRKDTVIHVVLKDTIKLLAIGDSKYIYIDEGTIAGYSYMLTPEAFIQISNQLLGITNDRNQTFNPSNTCGQDNISGSST
jgi:hypothetical protein